MTNLNDSGPGSLRDAIATTPFGGTADFQPGLSGTITLTTGELDIFKNLTISGPGADVIAVSGNHASRVFYTAATVAISGLTVANGNSLDSGGGIYNAGLLNLADCNINGNTARGFGTDGGGGIFNAGLLTITNSHVSGNSTPGGFGGPGGGGGIDNIRTATIASSVVSDNTAEGGGGLSNSGTMSLLDSTVSGNSATSYWGGGITNQGGYGGVVMLTVTSSTISDNSALQGGGIMCDTNGRTDLVHLTVVNSTISANTASQNGGGVNLNSTYYALVMNSTISGNVASRGGGIASGVTPFQGIRNTIIAQNMATVGPDVALNLNSLGHNLIGNTSGGSGFVGSDLLNVDPLLGPLQDNGGPTLTMALLPGSPAIGAGDPTDAPAWDQRGPGYPRVINGLIDIGAFEVQPVSASYVVTNTNDTGPGSLRQVILNADGSSDPVTITFDIPGTGVQTIRPLSPLPGITTPAVLDGTSQPGYAGRPLIVLDGSAAGAGADGLTVAAGNSTVEGLAVDAFAGAGIHLEGVGGDLVTGNYLGTDATGTLALGNVTGLFIDDTSGNTVGGTMPAAANLISGNIQAGVAISGSDNLVEGNRIGTDVTGTQPLSNGLGVAVFHLGAGNTIGGTAAGAGNLLSGNRDGVAIDGGSGNLVEGNRIGTDAGGTAALPNRFGIELFSGSTASTVGGTAPGAGNVIAGNARDGVGIYSNDNVLEGNLIGTDPTGTLDLGNGANGIAVRAFKYGNDNLIGGTAAGAGNTIAFNGQDGVLVDTGTGNALRQNSISNSGRLGIELVNGGNHGQAFPTLTSVTSDGHTTTIQGTLTSTPDTTFTLEFFADDVCNPSGYGEGQTFLGAAPVTTDDMGAATFTVTLGVGVAAGQFVSATATDPTGDTSAFAACVPVPSTAAVGPTPPVVGAAAVFSPEDSEPAPVPFSADAGGRVQRPTDVFLAFWDRGSIPTAGDDRPEPMYWPGPGVAGENAPGFRLGAQSDELQGLDLWT